MKDTDSTINKSKWILYKLSHRDDKKIWHELHRKTHRLRYVNTKMQQNDKSNDYTSAFRNQGHKFNNLSNISPHVSLLQQRKSWHGNGRSFSQLPRFRQRQSQSSNMTYQQALGLSDPLQNNFVSKHTNNRKCKLSKSQTLSSLSTIKIKDIDVPSSSFVTPPRSELFDLDKIAKEHQFDKIDTESVIFATNSTYWLRDNAGFTMNVIPKKQRKQVDDSLNVQKKLPKISKKEKKSNHTKQNNAVTKKKASKLRIMVDSRPLQSNRLSTISATPSTARSVRTSTSSLLNSPLLKVKVRERTPINHKMLKKYLYKNMFDNSKITDNKIFVLGTNSIQSQL